MSKKKKKPRLKIDLRMKQFFIVFFVGLLVALMVLGFNATGHAGLLKSPCAEYEISITEDSNSQRNTKEMSFREFSQKKLDKIFRDTSPYPLAQDCDRDGVPNSQDLCEGHNDFDDFDFDGVPNGCDACEGFDDSIDLDSDGIPDPCEGDCFTDTDCEAWEVCNGNYLCEDVGDYQGCVDIDGGNNIFEASMVIGYNYFGSELTEKDRCYSSGVHAGKLREGTCDSSVDISYIDITCPVDMVCQYGACRNTCKVDSDCNGFCYSGVCVSEMGDFTSWMEDKGYSEEIQNVYITETQESELFFEAFLDEVRRSYNVPEKSVSLFNEAFSLYSLLLRFKYESSFSMTVYNVHATNTGWTNDPFTVEQVMEIEEGLEEIYGRPFTLTVENVYVDYMAEFGSDPSLPPTMYPEVASQNYPGAIVFDSGTQQKINGLQIVQGSSNSDRCESRGNYYHFAAQTIDSGEYVAFDRSCYADTGCNILCTYDYSPGRYVSTAHELGHVFGFPHSTLTWGDSPSTMAGTDTIMLQPGRIMSATIPPNPGYEDQVLDDEEYPYMYLALSPIMRYALEPFVGYTDDSTYVSAYNSNARYRRPTRVQCGDVEDIRDDDNDGVSNACDLCLGHDDSIDSDEDGVPDGCDQCSGADYSGYLLFGDLANYDFDLDGTQFLCDSDEWCVGPEYNIFNEDEIFLDPEVQEITTGYLLGGSGPQKYIDECLIDYYPMYQSFLHQKGCYGGVVVGPVQTYWEGSSINPNVYDLRFNFGNYCTDLGYSACSEGRCI